MTAGPLSGVVVADFSRVLAGPLATMFLADLGATVIKVERPGQGDDTRAWGPPDIGSTSTYFTSVNRNKHSLTLDLSDEHDRGVAHTLVARADVLVENFRPGRLGRYGLDAPALAKTFPRLVYCSISGFGSGAGADLAGYDFLVQAVGGLMSITGATGGPPMKAGVALVDVLTGLHATIAIQAALLERDRNGRGQHVEVNLLSSLLASLVNQGAAFINGAGTPAAAGNQHPSIAPYETLATAGGPLAVAIGNDGQFAVLAKALGAEHLATDLRFATNRSRVAHRAELVAELEALLAVRTAEQWTEILQPWGLPCGPVNDIAQAITLAENLGLAPVVHHSTPDGDVATLASPLRFSATPVSYRRPPPGLGSDSSRVRDWLDGGPALD